MLLIVALLIPAVAAAARSPLLPHPAAAAAQASGGGAAAPAVVQVLDMDGNLVVPDVDAMPVPQASAKAEAQATPQVDGQRFAVPAVGLNVPLGVMSAVKGVVVPPGFTSAYVVRDFGVSLADAASGTVYIATHSLRGGGKAPGNWLIDIPDQRSAVSVGALITVGPLTYRVTGTSVVPKPQLAADKDVWRSAPGRLIVITCLQNRQGTPSTNNMVLMGTLQTSPTPTTAPTPQAAGAS